MSGSKLLSPQAMIDPAVAARMAALERFHILDTERDAVFDGIAELAAVLLDTPIAVVNFIADDRQWFKAEIGIGQRELPLDVSICRVALPERGIFVVPDLMGDDRFSCNPLVTAVEGLRFYAGTVLESEGVPIGTVCVLDTKPRADGISDVQRRGLEALAVQAMAALERSAAAGRDRFKLSLSEALLAGDDADEMMSVAARMIGEYLGVAQVGFGIVEKDGEYGTVGQEWNDGRMPSIAGRWWLDDFGQDRVAALKAGRTLAIADVHEEDRDNRAPAEAPYTLAIRSAVSVPLVRDGALVAVLFVHHPDVRIWRDDEIALIEDCAARLWNAVMRALADERLLESEATARARAEQIEAIYSAAPVGLAMFDRNLRYVSINEQLAQMNGASVADHIGKTPGEVVPGLADQPELDAQLKETFNRALAGEPMLGMQFDGVAAARPGVICTWRVNYLPMRDGTGEIVGVVLSVEEITEERLAEQALRASEATARARADELASIFAAAPVGLCVLDRQLRYLRMNDRLAEFSGVAAADYIGKTPGDTLPQFESQGAEIMQRVLAGESVMGAEFVGEMPGRPGAIRAWRANLIPLRDDEGEIVGVAAAAEEITVEKEAAEQLARAVERAEIAQGAAHAVIYEFDPTTGLSESPFNFPQVTGYSSDTPITVEWWQSLVHPDDLQMFGEKLELAVTCGNDYSVEYRLLHKDGHWIWLSDRGRAIAMGNGLHRLVGMYVDISEQRQAQQALVESELRYRSVFEQVGIGVARLSLEGRFLQINDRFCSLLGRNRKELIGKTWREITHPDDIAQDLAKLEQLLAGDGASTTIEKRYVSQDGGDIWANLTLSLVRDAADAPAFFVAMVEDIGARKLAEAAFADSEARLRAVVDAAPVGLIFADVAGKVTQGNSRVQEILGHSVSSLPRDYTGFHSDGRQVTDREWPIVRVVTGEVERAGFDVLYRRSDGNDIWVRFAAAAVRNEDDVLVGGVGACIDIDRETRLTQQLTLEVEHAVAERQTALAQLFEAQKLETIGQLTGGVAHDFNNLLTPIMGVLEMMQNRVAGEERASRLVAGALQSAERAKNLVQRLLAFARRQNLETKAIDLAELIAGMRDLIDRSIGPTIAVEVALGDALGPVSADANQLELALLNLAVNARDAMPGGGTLRLAARREEVEVANPLQLGPGSYVCLTVCDTGAGMDAETLKRCIEPFFTSKGIGEGTGLGLSMVHGMMRQLGGALHIISAPGQGTTMELWLACSNEQPEANPVQRAELQQSVRRSTILLVDDDELVRESTADMLDRFGYDVVQASNGAGALALLAGPGAIDALVTDYLMPGMTGRELAEQARRDRPDLPVLLITGYTRLDEIGPDLARLEKPFRQADFAARVAELVGGS